MIKRAEEWDDPPDDAHNPCSSESHAEHPSDAALLYDYSLPLAGKARSISDSVLLITFWDVSSTPQEVILPAHQPIEFCVRAEQGRVIASYQLLTGKLSTIQRTAVEQILSEAMLMQTQVSSLKVMRNIATLVPQDCWQSHIGEGPNHTLNGPQRMTLHVPDVNLYLNKPSILGRNYHSEGATASTRYQVAISLEPERSRVVFSLSLTDEGDAHLGRTERITVYCPAGIPRCSEEGVRRLRELAWRSLEVLWDRGPDEFKRYARQLRESYSSTYRKNLSSGACFTARTTPKHTTISITSCSPTTHPQGQEPGARYQWRFAGNMDHPQHPLNALFVGIKKAIRRPEADGQLTHAVDQLVTAARTSPHSRMTSRAARLDGLVDATTLRLLQNLPGVSLCSPRPGLGESSPISANAPHCSIGVHSIVEVLQGVSRFELHLMDSRFLCETPQAFSTLAVSLYPDRSAIVHAESPLGFSVVCSLSQASRFVRVLALDGLQPICAAFARQPIKSTPTDGRVGLLQILNQLVQFDPHNSHLTYTGLCAPPPPYDETANQLFDAVTVPLILRLQEACGKREALFRVESRNRKGIEFVVAHRQAPFSMRIVYSEGRFSHLSVVERSEQSRPRYKNRILTDEGFERGAPPELGHVFAVGTGRDVSTNEIMDLLAQAVTTYGQLMSDSCSNNLTGKTPGFIGSELHELLKDFFYDKVNP